MIEIVSAVENFCRREALDHRFVGGTFTDLVGSQTRYFIDVKEKRVTLVQPKTPSLIRADKTVKDIDLVVFTPDINKFKRARDFFNRWSAIVKSKGLDFPFISVEAARYDDWPKRNKLKQFVTAFEFDQNGLPHLAFGSTERAVKPSSLEPWTLDAGNGVEMTVFHPLAQILCYALRVPSGVKKKDKEVLGQKAEGHGAFNKMGLIGRLAVRTIKEGREAGLDYNEAFCEWIDYIHALSRNPDTLTKIKSRITGLYWNTIGTQVAHGAGVFGKLSTLSNKLTG